VCSAYDAMISERPHRPATSSERAIALLRRHRGSQCDPLVVGALLAIP